MNSDAPGIPYFLKFFIRKCWSRICSVEIATYEHEDCHICFINFYFYQSHMKSNWETVQCSRISEEFSSATSYFRPSILFCILSLISENSNSATESMKTFRICRYIGGDVDYYSVNLPVEWLNLWKPLIPVSGSCIYSCWEFFQTFTSVSITH